MKYLLVVLRALIEPLLGAIIAWMYRWIENPWRKYGFGYNKCETISTLQFYIDGNKTTLSAGDIATYRVHCWALATIISLCECERSNELIAGKNVILFCCRVIRPSSLLRGTHSTIQFLRDWRSIATCATSSQHEPIKLNYFYSVEPRHSRLTSFYPSIRRPLHCLTWIRSAATRWTCSSHLRFFSVRMRHESTIWRNYKCSCISAFYDYLVTIDLSFSSNGKTLVYYYQSIICCYSLQIFLSCFIMLDSKFNSFIRIL